MKYLLLVLSVVALASCAFNIQTAAQPQNRDEFRAAVAKGATFTKVDTYVANRRFDDVTRMLRKKTAECLNYRYTSSTRNAFTGLPTGTTASDYKGTFRTVNKSHAELTMQHHPLSPRIGPQMPQGGFYLIAVDVDRASARTTQLTFYGPSNWSGDTYEAIKKWSKGEAAPCPRP